MIHYMKLALIASSISLLVSCANDENEPINKDDLLVDYVPIEVKIHIESESGENLLSDIEGNWLNAPFSMDYENDTYTLDWDDITQYTDNSSQSTLSSRPSRHLPGFFKGIYIQPLKIWNDSKGWQPIPNSYEICIGTFSATDDATREFTFHVGMLNRDYNIKLVNRFDSNGPYKTGNVYTDLWLDGEKVNYSKGITITVPDNE